MDLLRLINLMNCKGKLNFGDKSESIVVSECFESAAEVATEVVDDGSKGGGGGATSIEVQNDSSIVGEEKRGFDEVEIGNEASEHVSEKDMNFTHHSTQSTSFRV